MRQTATSPRLEDDAAYEFDAQLQVYFDVRDNVIVSCGHPLANDCECNARMYAGMTVREARQIGGAR